jgi:hypothetical protein
VLFDKAGNLFPYEIVSIELASLEKVFVSDFKDSVTRRELFDNYLVYIEDLKALAGSDFHQWIDGSFVTNKQNPQDIDVVTFLSYTLYQRNISVLLDFKARENSIYKGIDGYFVSNFPVGHPYYFRAAFDIFNWQQLFGRDRQNRDKGIIQINFS